MGADGWRVKLFHRGHNITAKHNDFFRIADGKGFRWERHFQPWSLDSKSLAMVTWDKTPIHLYQIAAKRDKPLNYQPRFVRSAQWAPDIDRLLLTFTIEGVLVNQAGEQQALVRGGIEEGQTMHTYWMKAGKCFFILARQTNNSKTTLRFYSGLDGALQETHDLDPMDLVPYNWEDFVEMPRDRLCLEVVDPAIGAAGSMLDIWNSVLFDQASSSLLLAVFRPVSSPYREKGELLCKLSRPGSRSNLTRIEIRSPAGMELPESIVFTFTHFVIPTHRVVGISKQGVSIRKILVHFERLLHVFDSLVVLPRPVISITDIRIREERQWIKLSGPLDFSYRKVILSKSREQRGVLAVSPAVIGVYPRLSSCSALTQSQRCILISPSAIGDILSFRLSWQIPQFTITSLTD